MNNYYILGDGDWERQANKQALVGVSIFMKDLLEDMTPKLGFAE